MIAEESGTIINIAGMSDAETNPSPLKVIVQ